MNTNDTRPTLFTAIPVDPFQGGSTAQSTAQAQEGQTYSAQEPPLFNTTLLSEAIGCLLQDEALDQVDRGFGNNYVDIRQPTWFSKFTRAGKESAAIQEYQRHKIILSGLSQPDNIKSNKTCYLTECETLIRSARQLIALPAFGDQLNQDVIELILPLSLHHLAWLNDLQSVDESSHHATDVPNLVALKAKLFDLLNQIAFKADIPEPSNPKKGSATIHAKYALLSLPCLIFTPNYSKKYSDSIESYSSHSMQPLMEANEWLLENRHLLVGDNTLSQSIRTTLHQAKESRAAEVLTRLDGRQQRQNRSHTLKIVPETLYEPIIGEAGLKSLAVAHPSHSGCDHYIDLLLKQVSDTPLDQRLMPFLTPPFRSKSRSTNPQTQNPSNISSNAYSNYSSRSNNSNSSSNSSGSSRTYSSTHSPAGDLPHHINYYSLTRFFEVSPPDILFERLSGSELQPILTNIARFSPCSVDALRQNSEFWDQYAAQLVNHPNKAISGIAVEQYAHQIKREKAVQSTLAKIEETTNKVLQQPEADREAYVQFVKTAMLPNASILHRLSWETLDQLFAIEEKHFASSASLSFESGKIRQRFLSVLTKSFIRKLEASALGSSKQGSSKQTSSKEPHNKEHLNADEVLQKSIELAKHTGWPQKKPTAGLAGNALTIAIKACSIERIKGSVIPYIQTISSADAKYWQLGNLIVGRIESQCAHPAEALSELTTLIDLGASNQHITRTAIKRLITLSIQERQPEQLYGSIESAVHRRAEYRSVLDKPRFRRAMQRWMQSETEQQLNAWIVRFGTNKPIGKEASIEIDRRARQVERLTYLQALPGQAANRVGVGIRSAAVGTGQVVGSTLQAVPRSMHRGGAYVVNGVASAAAGTPQALTGAARAFGTTTVTVSKSAGKAASTAVVGTGSLAVGAVGAAGSLVVGGVKLGASAVTGTGRYISDQGMRIGRGISDQITFNKNQSVLNRCIASLSNQQLESVAMGDNEPVERQLERSMDLDRDLLMNLATNQLIDRLFKQSDPHAYEIIENFALTASQPDTRKALGMMLVKYNTEGWKKSGYDLNSPHKEALLTLASEGENSDLVTACDFVPTAKQAAKEALLFNKAPNTPNVAVELIANSDLSTTLTATLKRMDIQSYTRVMQVLQADEQIPEPKRQQAESILVNLFNRAYSVKTDGAPLLLEAIGNAQYSDLTRLQLATRWVALNRNSDAGVQRLMDSIDPKSDHFSMPFYQIVTGSAASPVSSNSPASVNNRAASDERETLLKNLKSTFDGFRLIPSSTTTRQSTLANQIDLKHQRITRLINDKQLPTLIRCSLLNGLLKSLSTQTASNIQPLANQLTLFTVQQAQDLFSECSKKSAQLDYPTQSSLRDTYKTAMTRFIAATDPKELYVLLKELIESKDSSSFLSSSYDLGGYSDTKISRLSQQTAKSRIVSDIDQGNWSIEALRGVIIEHSPDYIIRNIQENASSELIKLYDKSLKEDRAFQQQMMELIEDSSNYPRETQEKALFALKDRASPKMIIELANTVLKETEGSIHALHNDWGDSVRYNNHLLPIHKEIDLLRALLSKVNETLPLTDLDAIYCFAESKLSEKKGEYRSQDSTRQLDRLLASVKDVVQKKYSKVRDIRELADESKGIHPSLKGLIAAEMSKLK